VSCSRISALFFLLFWQFAAWSAETTGFLCSETLAELAQKPLPERLALLQDRPWVAELLFGNRFKVSSEIRRVLKELDESAGLSLDLYPHSTPQDRILQMRHLVSEVEALAKDEQSSLLLKSSLRGLVQRIEAIDGGLKAEALEDGLDPLGKEIVQAEKLVAELFKDAFSPEDFIRPLDLETLALISPRSPTSHARVLKQVDSFLGVRTVLKGAELHAAFKKLNHQAEALKSWLDKEGQLAADSIGPFVMLEFRKLAVDYINFFHEWKVHYSGPDERVSAESARIVALRQEFVESFSKLAKSVLNKLPEGPLDYATELTFISTAFFTNANITVKRVYLNPEIWTKESAEPVFKLIQRLSHPKNVPAEIFVRSPGQSDEYVMLH
jgi:hypothetical protein